MVDSRLEPHDANQLELKLGYKVRPERKRQRYLVESFMFVPRTLGVSARSYGPERFFEDTSTFIRLSTPAVALEALASEGRAASWFAPLGEELDALSAGRAASADGLVRSLKLLGSIYRAAIRDQGRLLLAGLAALPAPGAPKAEVREGAWVASMARFAEHLRAATARLRSAAQRCELANVPRAVAETWSAVDEHVSLCVEGRATALVAACDARGARAGGSPLSEVRDRLADVATDEYRYRQGRGYPSKAVAGEANEALPFRRRLLKRITSSVLFLDSEYEPGGELQRDLIAGVAAAAAMLFAVLVAIWAQVHWGALSATFAAVMVVAYIVKDRIKERGKRYLGRRLAGRLPDYVVKVRDPHSGRAIGVCREAVTVTEPSHIDADVRALRRADHDTVIGDDGRPEVVIAGWTPRSSRTASWIPAPERSSPSPARASITSTWCCGSARGAAATGSSRTGACG
ncbi:MAG: hypothetical protein CSA66_00565 [Proteobacteria bacterium]|nr:MAG: hypothetical protein CSA66_00565 [Pseudomonadota bacterium]